MPRRSHPPPFLCLLFGDIAPLVGSTPLLDVVKEVDQEKCDPRLVRGWGFKTESLTKRKSHAPPTCGKLHATPLSPLLLYEVACMGVASPCMGAGDLEECDPRLPVRARG